MGSRQFYDLYSFFPSVYIYFDGNKSIELVILELGIFKSAKKEENMYIYHFK